MLGFRLGLRVSVSVRVRTYPDFDGPGFDREPCWTKNGCTGVVQYKPT
jgi:hypothetical protein